MESLIHPIDISITLRPPPCTLKVMRDRSPSQRMPLPRGHSWDEDRQSLIGPLAPGGGSRDARMPDSRLPLAAGRLHSSRPEWEPVFPGNAVRQGLVLQGTPSLGKGSKATADTERRPASSRWRPMLLATQSMTDPIVETRSKGSNR